MFTVITEYKAFGTQPWSVTKSFNSREAALDYVSEECYQEDTMRVRCPELGLEEVGEFA